MKVQRVLAIKSHDYCYRWGQHEPQQWSHMTQRVSAWTHRDRCRHTKNTHAPSHFSHFVSSLHEKGQGRSLFVVLGGKQISGETKWKEVERKDILSSFRTVALKAKVGEN